MKLPQDPVMLLSVVNTLLRDTYPSVEALAAAAGEDAEEIRKRLGKIGYRYDQSQNQFK